MSGISTGVEWEKGEGILAAYFAHIMVEIHGMVDGHGSGQFGRLIRAFRVCGYEYHKYSSPCYNGRVVSNIVFVWGKRYKNILVRLQNGENVVFSLFVPGGRSIKNSFVRLQINGRVGSSIVCAWRQKYK